MRFRTNIIEKYNTQFEYAGILMKIAIAVQFGMLLFTPRLNQIDTITTMAGLLMFEFFMVHSGVFMAAMPRSISLFVFVPFYGLFAFAFNSIVANNLILFGYLAVVMNRMRFAFSDVSMKIRIQAFARSRAAAIRYIGLLIPMALFAEYLPVLGLNDTFLKQSGYSAMYEGANGIFTTMPHVPMAFGMLYYLSMAYWEFSYLHNPERADEPVTTVEEQAA